MSMASLSRMSIRETIKARDGLSDEEIDDMISDAKSEIHATIDAGGPAALGDLEDIVLDYFGLEPDYLHDPELDVF